VKDKRREGEIMQPKGTLFDTTVLKAKLLAPSSLAAPWAQPEHPLPIDKCINALQGRSRAPKLREPTAFKMLSRQCPYFSGRMSIICAVEQANVALQFSQNGIKLLEAKISRNTKAAHELRKMLEARLDTSTTAENPFSDYNYEEMQKLEHQSEEVARLVKEAAEALQIETDLLLAKKKRSPSGRGRPDIWKIQFATTLGFAFYHLTGSKPALSDNNYGFLRFVEAAYECICETEESWERQCRTAIAYVKSRPLVNHWNFMEFIKQEPVDPQEVAAWIDRT
jgi:hypothetical protein